MKNYIRQFPFPDTLPSEYPLAGDCLGKKEKNETSIPGFFYSTARLRAWTTLSGWKGFTM
jgi:hypothetical protein